VTLVYCGQTVGWIKMKLAMQVGLGPGHIVLYGDPSPSKGVHPIFGPRLLWPNARPSQLLLSTSTWHDKIPPIGQNPAPDIFRLTELIAQQLDCVSRQSHSVVHDCGEFTHEPHKERKIKYRCSRPSTQAQHVILRLNHCPHAQRLQYKAVVPC